MSQWIQTVIILPQDKTFEGGYQPYLGAVFMDTITKDFSDQLDLVTFGAYSWNKVADHRMFNDVNFYDNQSTLTNILM